MEREPASRRHCEERGVPLQRLLHAGLRTDSLADPLTAQGVQRRQQEHRYGES